MTISAVYANGVQATAISNIKVQVALCISTLADGSKSFDTQKMQKWLTDQGNILIDEIAPHEYEDQSAAETQLAITSTLQDTNTLAHWVNKERWMAHSEWPASLSYGSSAFIAAVATGMKQLETASAAVGAAFTTIEQEMPKAVAGFYVDSGIDAVVPRGVALIVEDRFYIITYVTDRGEESAPSPVSVLATLDQNDTVTITLVTPPENRYISKWRIYRTNVGSAGAAFQFVAEQDIAVTTYIDSKKGSELDEVCPSLTWAEPPSKLQGLVAMPNGVLAGFFGNTICFSESFIPYAWPVEYQLTTAHPIIGMAVFGQTLVVGTQGGTDYVSGADAASMSQQQSVSLQACVSARSMVSVEGGVVFASPDGLCLATSSGVIVLTNDLMTRDQWQELVPASMVCAYHESTVYLLGGGFSGAYALHLQGKLTTLEVTASAMYVDHVTDRAYTVTGTTISAMFGHTTGKRTAIWRSKIVVMEAHAGFAWLTAESDFSAPITVKWYGDGELRHTAVLTSRTPVRLPPGRYLEHEIEVSSAARWNSLTLASTTEELKSL